MIPVMVRKVDFKGLPFAELQMLSKNAVPIVPLKEGGDVALNEVAEGVRHAAEKVIHRRLRLISPERRSGSQRESRTLEAAVARVISVGEYREVVARVSLASSDSLGFAISLEGDFYSCTLQAWRPNTKRNCS